MVDGQWQQLGAQLLLPEKTLALSHEAFRPKGRDEDTSVPEVMVRDGTRWQIRIAEGDGFVRQRDHFFGHSVGFCQSTVQITVVFPAATSCGVAVDLTES